MWKYDSNLFLVFSANLECFRLEPVVSSAKYSVPLDWVSFPLHHWKIGDSDLWKKYYYIASKRREPGT